MSSTRERAAQAQVERRLQHQDPGFVRQFSAPLRPSPHPWVGKVLTIVMGVLALLTALAALTGAQGVAAGLALACGVVGLTTYFEEVRS